MSKAGFFCLKDHNFDNAMQSLPVLDNTIDWASRWVLFVQFAETRKNKELQTQRANARYRVLAAENPGHTAHDQAYPFAKLQTHSSS